jgi:heat shock protein HslJ
MRLTGINSFARVVLMATVIVMTSGCEPSGNDGPTRVAPQPMAALSLTELRNAAYLIDPDNGPVTLTAGTWRGQPYTEEGTSRPGAGLVDDFLVAGDLNADGTDEAVVLLWTNSGGSGTFDYLAVMSRDEAGKPVNLATAELGDRVQVRAAAIDAGRIVVDIIQTGPNDAACCPGQKMRRSFVLERGVLVEAESQDLGRQSIADLADVDWFLQRFDHDDEVPDGIEITLTFDGERIFGGSGCNRYNGSVVEGRNPGALTTAGPMASTRMACPPPADEIEIRYLQRLQGIEQYSFIAGKLALSWRTNDEFGTLIFANKK